MRKRTIYPKEFPEFWSSDWGEDPFGLWMAFTYKGVRQIFRWIEPGTFEMGSPENEPERWDDEIQHTVTLTHGFWFADRAVTQAMWHAVMNENPSHFKGENCPVDSVSWNNAQAFIGKLNSMKPELSLCLPTEAQWEYACRAGTQTPFSFGSQIDSDLVNFDGTHPYNNGKASQNREETVEVKNPASECLGSVRNAWQCLGMVSGLVWRVFVTIRHRSARFGIRRSPGFAWRLMAQQRQELPFCQA